MPISMSPSPTALASAAPMPCWCSSVMKSDGLMKQDTPREQISADANRGLMAGKRGLVMGVANDHSIAWGIAHMLAGHGAEIAFTYQGEAQKKRLGPLAASIGSSLVMPGDVESDEQLDAAFAVLAKEWGSIDFLVHA